MNTIPIKKKILDSLKPIVDNSSFVSINQQGIDNLAEKLKNSPLYEWDNEMQFLGDFEETVQYYFFVDSINFCFWNEKEKERWQFQKNGEWINGYYAFSCAIKQAFLKNKNLFDAAYLSQIPFDEFSEIFIGRGELLLLRERHQIIQENFSIIQEKYEGKAAHLVAKAQHDVNTCVGLLLEDFPSFRDWVKLQNQTLYFLKRAQLFPSDLYHAFKGEGYGHFKNMGDLTVFADYKLPQFLEMKGVLVYADDLRNKLQNQELIEQGSKEEIEIRANTILACEMLLAGLEKLGRGLTASDLDWMLWDLSTKTKLSLPYHRTISINY
ncbi:MAG: queuosine salvage family protein [bacterium]|nr:queuosine salvage family protein [bacterium]